jgi:hypothetical protein
MQPKRMFGFLLVPETRPELSVPEHSVLRKRRASELSTGFPPARIPRSHAGFRAYSCLTAEGRCTRHRRSSLPCVRKSLRRPAAGGSSAVYTGGRARPSTRSRGRAGTVVSAGAPSTAACERPGPPAAISLLRRSPAHRPDCDTRCDNTSVSAPQNRDGSGRWPKGVSGNPGGRPKGQAALSRTTRELVGEDGMKLELLWNIAQDPMRRDRALRRRARRRPPRQRRRAAARRDLDRRFESSALLLDKVTGPRSMP